jgi:hypothetical protein
MKNRTTPSLLCCLSLLLLGARALALDAYEAAVQARSPVGYWRLNDTVAAPPLVVATNLGTLGTNGNGTFENDIILGVAGALPAQSSSNSAVRGLGYLNGNRVRVPYQGVFNTNNDFSVEFWCKPAQTNTLVCPAASAEFADPSTNSAVRRGWLFYQGNLTDSSGNGWLFRIYNPPNGTATPQQINCAVVAAVDTNKWYHIVGTYKSANPNKGLTLYVNGASVATASVTAAYENVKTNTIPLTFGARADGDFGFFTFLGNIDEGAFYPSALTAAQVLAHYQNGTNSAPSSTYQSGVLSLNPSGYWRLNEKPGPPAANLGSSAAAAEYLYAVTPGVPGPQSPAFTGFSATNKAITITTNNPGCVRTAPLALNTNTVTLAAWIQPSGAQNAYSGIFTHASAIDGSYAGLNMGPNGGLEIGYTWNDDSATYNFSSGVTVPAGQWSFVAVTVDPNQAVVYAHDGTTFQSSTNVTPHAVQGFNGLSRIGMDYIGAPVTVFNGAIDEMAVFKRAFSMGEVYSLYAAGKGGLGPTIFQDVVAPPTIAVGETLALSVDAGGTPNLTYQWRKNGGAIGSNTNTYSKPNLVVADGGNYDVIITNTFGAVTSSVVTINLQPQTFPTISSQPQGRTVYRGGYVNLSVTADGGNLGYFWQLNGAPVPGGTNAAYLITSADATNTGSYSVIVSNSVGAVTSAPPALVSVIVPAAGSFEEAMVADHPVSWWRLDEAPGSPTFADAMGRHDGTWVVPPTLGAPGVVAGGSNTAAQFTLAAQAYGEVPFAFDLNSQSITVECWVNTSDISDTLVPVSSWVAAPNHKGYMFVKQGPDWQSAFSFGDAYVYTYVDIGTMSPGRWTHLAFTSSPSDGWSIYLNGQLVDGPFSPTGWVVNNSGPFRIGTDVPGSSSYNDFFDGTIDEVAVYNTVLPASSLQAHYERAKFGAGAPPQFVTQPASQTAAEGLTVTFSPVVEGSRPLVYAWSKDGSPLGGQTNATLTVTNVAFTNTGSYVLAVSNGFGASNSQPATLTVVGQPTFANLTNGLVLHLKFDGDYLDSTGRGNNGTNVGATALVAGKIGSGSLSYSTTTNASGQYSYNCVDLGIQPDLQFGSNTDFSVAFWVQFTGTPNDLPFLANSDSSLGSAGYTIAPSFGGGGLGWSLNAYRFESDTNLLNDGNWHHVVVSVARTANIVTYVDGAVIDSRFATTENLDTGFNTVVGQGCFFDYAQVGSFTLDDLGVWRRALAPNEAYTAWYVGANYGRTFDHYGPVVLQVRPNGSGLDLVWQAGTLEQATSLNGPWSTVVGASAPHYPVPIGPGNKFYRVRL